MLFWYVFCAYFGQWPEMKSSPVMLSVPLVRQLFMQTLYHVNNEKKTFVILSVLFWMVPFYQKCAGNYTYFKTTSKSKKSF